MLNNSKLAYCLFRYLKFLFRKGEFCKNCKTSGFQLLNCVMFINNFSVDDIPPDVTCPDEVVVKKYNTKLDQANISISHIATAWDYSGSGPISYHYDGRYSALPLRHFINVTASASDSKGNTGTCNFLYEGKSKLFLEFVFHK